jgi:hypothetical protein
MTRRCEEHIARDDRHHPSAWRLDRDRERIDRQFEGADVALLTAFRSESSLRKRRYPPQHGRALDVRGQISTRHPCRGLRLLLSDDRLLPLSVDRWARPVGRDVAAASAAGGSGGRELIATEMAVTSSLAAIPKIPAIC